MRWLSLALLAGLFAASPFLTNRAMGTNEAYNYSLSIADAVIQFRTGNIPMLVGQTEYAFNGRIHPLRTAPALAYAASLLDLITFRQLGFWTLQNLVLALALIGGSLTCYRSLRVATPASPAGAALLSSLYVLSPSVLAAAYGMDLFMTVLAIPLIPLAIAANVLCLQGRWSGLVRLAVALAGCWLAHPPVALWLSVASLPMLGAAICLRRPRGWLWGHGVAAVFVFLVLGGFALASALTVTPATQVIGSAGATGFAPQLDEAFAHSLLPVSRTADQLGDFQLGYAYWLLGGCVILAARRARSREALVLLSAAGLLLCFVLPVPGLTSWFWANCPAPLVNITGAWPMQRLYPPATCLLLFAAAFVRPPVFRRPPLVSVLLVAAICWTAGQAAMFIRRGFGTHRSAEDTARSHAAGNLDLTLISYAFARPPHDFISGVRDPAQAFRILAPYDLHELASNASAPLPESAERISGTLSASTGDGGRYFTAPGFVLQPGRRYRLDLDFLVPPFAGRLILNGPLMRRSYALPSAGGPRGFGMNPGNVPRLTLWTDLPGPETVSIALLAEQPLTTPDDDGLVARFTLSPFDRTAMPVELLASVPLRVRVQSPAAGYLETPRIFLPGYQATVDGRTVRVQRSPEGLALLPVPAGTSIVELNYTGPWFLVWSFRLACVGWLGVVLIMLSPSTGAERAVQTLTARASRLMQAFRRRPALGVGLAAALLAASALGLTLHRLRDNRDAAGPIRLRFTLPRGETNRQQPLVVMGKPQAGTFVYVVYHDAEHVRIGVDVWGLLGEQTGPIRADYFGEHEVIIEAGSLYPPEAGLSPEARKRVEKRLRITFNGTTVLDREIQTYESTPDQVTIGRNLIGGSSCEPDFAGQILSVERLPVPAD